MDDLQRENEYGWTLLLPDASDSVCVLTEFRIASSLLQEDALSLPDMRSLFLDVLVRLHEPHFVSKLLHLPEIQVG